MRQGEDAEVQAVQELPWKVHYQLMEGAQVNIQDTGTGRRMFGSGAERDRAEGKGRFDLLPMYALEQIAKVFEAGARKYAPRNWEKGIPNSSFVDSAMRHMTKFTRGEWDEPHLVQAAWNLLCAIDQQERIRLGKLDPVFDDIGARVDLTAKAHCPNQRIEIEVAPSMYTKTPDACEYYTMNATGCQMSPCPDCDIQTKEN